VTTGAGETYSNCDSDKPGSHAFYSRKAGPRTVHVEYHLLQYSRNCILPDSVFVCRMKLTIQSDGAPNYHQLIDFYNGRVLVRS